MRNLTSELVRTQVRGGQQELQVSHGRTIKLFLERGQPLMCYLMNSLFLHPKDKVVPHMDFTPLLCLVELTLWEEQRIPIPWKAPHLHKVICDKAKCLSEL